jgi:hypothetical protein
MSGHWQSFRFSTNYFDQRHLFIFAFLCAPLLVQVTVLLVVLTLDIIKENPRPGPITGSVSWLKKKMS